MTRFWKFNSFVGSVATACLVGAYFAGKHHEGWNNQSLQWSWESTLSSQYLLSLAVFWYAWQFLATVLGLLVNFFGALNER